METVLLKLAIPFMALILAISADYDLDPLLVASQVKAESGFDPKAVSPVGAIGLMQVMPRTAEWLKFNPALLFDPEVNLRCGMYYDRWLLKYWRKEKSWVLRRVLMLASYNAGQGRVKKHYVNGKLDYDALPHETRVYVKRILGYDLDYRLRLAKKLIGLE